MYATRSKSKSESETTTEGTKNNLTEVDVVGCEKSKVLQAQVEVESNKVGEVVVRSNEVNGKSLKTDDNSFKSVKETVVKCANNNMANEQLNELIKLLTVKYKIEEEQQKNVSITVDTFEKIVPEFNGENIAVEQWFKNFNENADAYGLNTEQKYVQARNKMTGAAKLFLDSIVVCNYKSLETHLVNEFKKSYSAIEIHKMLTDRKKNNSESFHEYMLQMRKIAAFGDMDTKSVIRYIVDGLKIKEEFKYQLYSTTTFTELREKYEIYEMVKKDSDNNYKRNTGKDNKVNKNEHCFNCGSKDHKKSECKSAPKCFKCNRYGHIAKNCGSNVTENQVNLINEENRLKKVNFNDKELECFVDPGADVSIMKNSCFRKHFISCKLEPSYTILSGLGGTKTQPVGRIKGVLKVDNIESAHEFLIVADKDMKFNAILGFDFLGKYTFSHNRSGYVFVDQADNKVMNEMLVYNVHEIDVDHRYRTVVENMVKNFTFEPKVEECPIVMKIIPNESMRPFRHAPSRLSVPEEEAVNKQIKEWLEDKIIRKSTSNMASRIVLTKKKCGSYRICVDYRQLNKMVLKDLFPVPIIDDVLQKLQSAKFFTVMDLKNGFFHVPVDEQSKKYTAFITKRGLFEFNRAPFGFCNSPPSFIRYVNYIFQDLINSTVMELYVDDIIIYAENAEECLNKLNTVLRTASRFGLQFNWTKCAFMKTKIEFLGHVVENGSIYPGRAKAKAVKNFPLPKNTKDVQSFLGLTGYFRKFIDGYARIVRPLSDLLQKEATFRITEKEAEAMNTIKKLLTEETVLKIYCRNAETEVHTDASKYGFGATLMQKFEGSFHPVYFWSKKTSPQESAMHSYVLEVKAAYLAFKKFRQYLLGINVKLVTDCSAFKHAVTKKDISRCVAQWILYLEDFSFTVEHRAASRMKHVDSLSRYPVDIMVIASELTARIRKLQNKDEQIKAIVTALQAGPYNNYKIKGGLVYKNEEGNDLLLVPKVLEAEIIRNSHEIGHFGSEKTMHAVRQQYFIPHLQSKVEQMIQNCIKCIIQNKKLGIKEGYLQCISKGDNPLHTLHVDHLGPLDATAKKYKYIFAMVDGFSKFVWLFPTKTTNTEEVLKSLQIWSEVFGFPDRIISDRGAAFTSSAFKDFCSESGVEHVLTTTGVPRGNGQIERVNRTIINIISKFSSDDTTRWYKYVGQVQKAINACINSTTKATPFEILFGRKMKVNVDSQLLDMLEQELVERYDEERNELRLEAKRQIIKAQELYKRNYDKNRRGMADYRLGDLVAIKQTQFTPGRKLANEYIGPYEVTKVKRGGRYDVVKAAEFEGPNSTSSSGDNMKWWKQQDDNFLSSGTDEEQDGRM